MRILNLNNYDVVSQEDATLKVVMMAKEGMTAPVLWLRGKKSQGGGGNSISYAEMVAGTKKWNRAIKFKDHNKITPGEYIELVDWWFMNARSDEAYADSINERFIAIGDIKGEIEGLKDWLVGKSAYNENYRGEYTDRKICIGQFLTGRLTAKKKQIRNREKYRRG